MGCNSLFGGTIERFMRPSICKHASLSVTRLPMDDKIAQWEIVLLAGVRLEARYIHVLDSLAFRSLVGTRPRSFHRIERPAYRKDPETLRVVGAVWVSLYQHRQIRIPTEL